MAELPNQVKAAGCLRAHTAAPRTQIGNRLVSALASVLNREPIPPVPLVVSSLLLVAVVAATVGSACRWCRRRRCRARAGAGGPPRCVARLPRLTEVAAESGGRGRGRMHGLQGIDE